MPRVIEVRRAILKMILIVILGMLLVVARVGHAQSPKRSKPQVDKIDSVRCGRIVGPILWSPNEGVIIMRILFRGKVSPDSLTMSPDETSPLFSGFSYDFSFSRDSLVASKIIRFHKPCPPKQQVSTDPPNRRVLFTNLPFSAIFLGHFINNRIR
jgi:hypothetical protein